MKSLTIDRFEGKIAVCENEDGDAVEIDKNELPKEAKVGDIIKVKDEKYIIDNAATKQRKEKIEKLADELFGP